MQGKTEADSTFTFNSDIQTYKDTGPANKSKQNKALQISVTYFAEITRTEAVLHFKVR